MSQPYNIHNHVITMSQPCYNHVTTMSQPCQSGVITMSQPCHNHVITMSQPFYNQFKTMSQQCHNHVTTISQPCHNHIITMLQPCHKRPHWQQGPDRGGWKGLLNGCQKRNQNGHHPAINRLAEGCQALALPKWLQPLTAG